MNSTDVMENVEIVVAYTAGAALMLVVRECRRARQLLAKVVEAKQALQT